MKTGLIYIIKNTVNNKVYVGQTTTNLNTRFSQHTKKSTVSNRFYKLHNAIRKYGKDKFYIEPLETNIPIEQLNEREIYYIEKFNSYKNGYNTTKGGDGRTINANYDEQQIIHFYKQGMSCADIGKLYGVCGATINRVLSRKAIIRRHDGNKYESFGEKFCELWNNGAPIKDLAKIYNVNEKTIRRATKHYNLSPRHSHTKKHWPNKIILK